MHEWSLAIEIVKIAEKELKERNAKKVEEVFLEIGSLNNIVVEQLIDAFEIAKKGTLLDDAKLYVEKIEAVAFCNKCNKRSEIDPPFIFCPLCMGNDVKIEKGEELHLKKLTLEF